ncbi:hypothetical protein ACFY1U_50830 [Streptomyces sp. NPDC001351]|uniref:hypothetical protein n=1 Tax=Streptomyces sp. NPDC001351 TaxID=3364564 RepID=UPI0036938343
MQQPFQGPLWGEAALDMLPADDILTEPGLALLHLLNQSGTRPEHWDALLEALDCSDADEKITFGQLLDRLKGPLPASASTA